MQKRAVTAALAALALAAAGCGGGDAGGGSGGGTPDLTVSAASSLTDAFTKYGGQFHAAHARFSFAGSDELAAQIQQGVKPDVFASANTTLPDALHAKGLVGRPVLFTSNRLVIAVPAGATRVRSLADLARPGVKIAVGAAAVPIGAYTRKVLAGLPAGERRGILANVRSNEPDVKSIVAKVTEKAVDAGFVYVTDVTATGGRARAVALPDRLQPRVAYAAAVVTGSKHPAEARAFIDGLLRVTGRHDLRAAGFLPPP
jgi:molybdate transport system substrate-binding protein